MADRTSDYEALLRAAICAGYALMSVRDFIDFGQAAPRRIMVLRHDIDTDPATARRLFEIERSLGVLATYYFRLTTLDIRLMVELEKYGSEASYHFEEIADFVKRHDIRCPAQLRARMGEVEDQFFINFTDIERRTGIKLRTVASHGDFVNRKLGIINHELLQNAALRQRCGITHEAYDQALMQRFGIYISDRPCPELYCPCSPLEVFGIHERIYFTSHPVHWRTNWRETSRHNLTRLRESWSW
ncbi:hypothetical protein [Telluria antibiotica]|nr:hypothetical protein [Telluria antibiotica]